MVTKPLGVHLSDKPDQTDTVAGFLAGAVSLPTMRQ